MYILITLKYLAGRGEGLSSKGNDNNEFNQHLMNEMKHVLGLVSLTHSLRG